MRVGLALQATPWSETVLSFMVALWRGWKSFTHKLIAGQNWIIMAFVYVTAMGPVSLAIKMNKDRRLDREPADPNAETYGLKVDFQPPDVRRAQRPY